MGIAHRCTNHLIGSIQPQHNHTLPLIILCQTTQEGCKEDAEGRWNRLEGERYLV
jgi:hypothetical protein